MPTATKYSYAKACDSGRLTQEISDSSIVTALDHIVGATGTVDIWFKDALSGTDETTLTDLVTAHVNTPLPDDTTISAAIVSQPDPPPFATPSYRTKRNSTDDLTTCPPNATTEILFLLTAERYVHGGCLLVKNPEFGDYIYAEVEDIDGVIPAPYRATLCEAWPVVAKYIVKEWVHVDGSGYTIQDINTYPLTAKISAGLYLSLHYVAINAGVDRVVGVNYYKTKKL